MTDLGQIIGQFIQQNGLATGILSILLWFLIARVWPWYSGQFWPMMLKNQERRDKLTAELRDAVNELRALTQRLVDSMEQHDATTRDLVLALGSNQQAILDLLSTRATHSHN